jgi:hypothetical protein
MTTIIECNNITTSDSKDESIIETDDSIDIKSTTYQVLPPVPPYTSSETEQDQTVLRLELPSDLDNDNENVHSGNFQYIKDKHSREMIENGYNAVNQTETWGFLKKAVDSYTFSDAPEVQLIYKKMEELGYHGHSGCSFGWTMRNLQSIAINGEINFRRSWKNKTK